MRASIRRSIDENHSIENAKLELNGLKFTYDSSFEDIAIGCLTGIMVYCDTISKKNDLQDFLVNFKGVLEGKDGKRCWKEVLEHFLKLGVKKSRLLLLTHLLYFVASDEGASFTPALEMILKILKFLELVDSDTIIEWYDEHLDEESTKPILAQCKKFVSDLEEGSEEEEDEDEDEEEEEEEEEDEEEEEEEEDEEEEDEDD